MHKSNKIQKVMTDDLGYSNQVLKARTILFSAINLLTKNEKKKLYTFTFLNSSLAVVDILALGLIGIITFIATQPENFMKRFGHFQIYQSFTLQEIIFLTSLLALVLFILKTILGLRLNKATMNFLSFTSSRISSDSLKLILTKHRHLIQERSRQELVFSLTSGVDYITMHILAPSTAVIVDSFLLLGLSIVLGLVSLKSLIFFMVMFAILLFVLQKHSHRRSFEFGRKVSSNTVISNELINQGISSYRELYIGNYEKGFVEQVSRVLDERARYLSQLFMLPQISKYTFELAIILSSMFFIGFQTLVLSPKDAVTTITLYLATGSRLAPAILRMQQNVTQVKSSIGFAESSLRLVQSLRKTSSRKGDVNPDQTNKSSMSPVIEVNSLSAKYFGDENFALKNISVSFQPGSFSAIVGSSGSGKTTLVDAILGLIPLTDGNVKISNMNPWDFIAKWPGSIALVPQEVNTFSGTILDNLSIGFDGGDLNEDLIWEKLRLVGLEEFISSLPLKLQTQVGDSGAKLSGGERQRLGIARALITSPKILILDEATSALDGINEEVVLELIRKMHGKVTIIMIAHKLSIIKTAENIIYLSGGEVLSIGDFDFIRSKVPEFDLQARLAGL
jgi:ABC-type multidrug transport system fused ATPase/permease subunit